MIFLFFLIFLSLYLFFPPIFLPPQTFRGGHPPTQNFRRGHVPMSPPLLLLPVIYSCYWISIVQLISILLPIIGCWNIELRQFFSILRSSDLIGFFWYLIILLNKEVITGYNLYKFTTELDKENLDLLPYLIMQLWGVYCVMVVTYSEESQATLKVHLAQF